MNTKDAGRTYPLLRYTLGIISAQKDVGAFADSRLSVRQRQRLGCLLGGINRSIVHRQMKEIYLPLLSFHQTVSGIAFTNFIPSVKRRQVSEQVQQRVPRLTRELEHFRLGEADVSPPVYVGGCEVLGGLILGNFALSWGVLPCQYNIHY